MPRKAKENKELNEIQAEKKTKSSSKKTTNNSVKKSTEISKTKKTSKKSTTSTKNTSSKNTTNKKDSKTKSSTKRTSKSLVKIDSKKSLVKVNNSLTVKKETALTEYYDLPLKYNKTVVKILAQTPKTLFVYWEISDDDISNYKKLYGENFFENTKPVLIVYNDSLNYSFEVEINDFANSWYLHVNDSKSNYRVELGRRPINNYNEQIYSNYIYISSSNEIESPNDHILFNSINTKVYFRNVKTNSVKERSLSEFALIKGVRRIYNIYDLYKTLYKENNLDDFSNPSSNSSSKFI